MNLYNIHTHRVVPESDNNLQVRSILNTYPSGFASSRTNDPRVSYSCGIHPWYADRFEEQFSLLQDIVADSKVVAIGEAGLDKLQGPAMDLQIRVFEKQIQLAASLNKPLIIHCVKAWDELVALHKKYSNEHSPAWIIHGYRGNPQQTEQLAKQGFKFSIGQKYNIEAIKSIPRSSLFCETDMSDISICQVYKDISKDMDVNINHFAIFVEENVRNVFNI